MDRREFLRRTAQLGGAVALGGPALAANARGALAADDFGSMLDDPAKESPIDTVVVVMMENRSFDHYVGWLADDKKYIERGKSRYGKRFRVNGKQVQSFPGPDGAPVQTAPLLTNPAETNPYRGCGHPDPGHQWTQGRAQRDGGFLAPGSGNDTFALGYYGGDALPFTSQLAREFTVFDRWHASILGPTYPNRAYLHSAQSGTYQTNMLPTATGGYDWETIWDRLAAARVSTGYYFTDLPVLALWGGRLDSVTHPITDYFEQAQAGKLPRVVFVDPAFLTGNRTDDHPLADIRAGQRFLRDVFAAFARSKHWKRGAFVLMYDEWGGFYDHVKPPDPAGQPGERGGRRQLRPSRIPRTGGGRVAVRAAAATSITPCTTTRRCSGSSSGASSARPPAGPGKPVRPGSSPSATAAPTTSAPASRRIRSRSGSASTSTSCSPTRRRPAGRSPAWGEASRSARPSRRRHPRTTPSSTPTTRAGSSASAST